MAAGRRSRVTLYPKVRQYVEGAVSEFGRIPEERKTQLEVLTSYIQAQLNAKKPVNLTFICTANSRRSQLAQIWAQTAAAYYSIPNVTVYSGGIECTAFNPRAVAACKRAGLRIIKTTEAENPIYHVRYGSKKPPITCFSKIYNNAPNPSKGYCAVMTCANADKACPVVIGASKRIALHYVDPKEFDGTKLEAQKYDERTRQICREVFYAFSKVQK
jgi:arsenate reductase (thioredoxin)